MAQVPATKRRRRAIGQDDRERFNHPSRPLTDQEQNNAATTVGDALDSSYSVWDANHEGQWFQDIRMPPCTLTTTMYDKVLGAMVRSLKGNVPFYATAALKQVLFHKRLIS